MANENNAQGLARAWIQGLIGGDPDDIPLSDDFVHTSPFGTIEGRDIYLEKIKPASEANVARLTILQTMGADDKAVIRIEMETPNGTIPCVDWVTLRGDAIVRVHSFYDATLLR